MDRITVRAVLQAGAKRFQVVTVLPNADGGTAARLCKGKLVQTKSNPEKRLLLNTAAEQSRLESAALILDCLRFLSLTST